MKIAKKIISKIKPYKPGKPIEEVKRELGVKSVIKLASNENALRPPLGVMQAVFKAAGGLNRYPDGGCFYLKKALAKKHSLKPENIIVGNGSDEIIVLALRAFLLPGDEVIVAKPTFLIYGIAAAIEGAKIKYVPLKNYRYDLEAMADAVTKKTKIVFISNPDNPTGTYVTGKEFGLFMRNLPRNTIVFLDEAYFDFASRAKDYPRSPAYLKKKNIIITRSFSKIYSLAGLRVGYGMADKKIIECLDKVREPFNVNSVAQAAALEALKDKNHVNRTVQSVEKQKSYLYRELERLGFTCVPSVTNFILFKGRGDAKKVYKKLLKKGVIIREMSAWGLRGFMRVTAGTPRENRRFIAALKGVI